MNIQTRKPLLPLLSMLFVCFLTTTAQAQRPSTFTGVWVDQKNPAMLILVKKVNGIYRVIGGDGSFGYEIACLQKKMAALCTGYGGLLEGQNFLYYNTLEFMPNGMISETWKAFNNLQTVKGKTIWKRK